MPPPMNYANVATLTGYTPSCGKRPIAAYIRIPFRCRLLKATGILGGRIDASDGLIVVSEASHGSTLMTFAIPQAGSAAGQLYSATPLSPTYLNEDDVIALTPSDAGGESVPMHFSITIRAA